MNDDFTSNTTDAGPAVVKRTKGGKKDPKAKYPKASTSNSAGADEAPPPRASKNTAVFVSALPLDATSKEIYDCFSRFGVIEIDDEEQPKIKMYTNSMDGEFSGEALVVYFKEESVELAITMLDDAELRLGEQGTRMRVKKAEFGHKSQTQANPGGEGGAQGEKVGGEHKPRQVDRKKATKRIGKMMR